MRRKFAHAMAAAALGILPLAEADGSIPLFFVPGPGQGSDPVRFLSKGSGVTAYFSADGAAFRMNGDTLTVRFPGAPGPKSVEAGNELPGRVNFLVGPPEKWRTGVRPYGRLIYRD